MPCSQVWQQVQVKWMYLESIFIGGDIRSQLPDEAKKFDNIDKVFKKVFRRRLCVSVREKGRYKHSSYVSVQSRNEKLFTCACSCRNSNTSSAMSSVSAQPGARVYKGVSHMV